MPTQSKKKKHDYKNFTTIARPCRWGIDRAFFISCQTGNGWKINKVVDKHKMMQYYQYNTFIEQYIIISTNLLDREKDLERLWFLSLDRDLYLRLSLDRDLENKRSQKNVTFMTHKCTVSMQTLVKNLPAATAAEAPPLWWSRMWIMFFFLKNEKINKLGEQT